tara:strand:+ start:81 stop:536 length:456 start_codon:yes stop_codon:yes gene_type:complete
MELTRLGKCIENNQFYINSGVFGFISHILLNLIGIVNNYEEINYYGIIESNIYVDVITIPFIIYGILLLIPLIISKTDYEITKIQKSLCIMFMCYYLIISVYITIGIMIIYINPLLSIEKISRNYNDKYLFMNGLKISFITLLFKEIANKF